MMSEEIMKNILTAYCSDAGLHKKVNEDSLLIKTAEYDGIPIGLFCVCDGLGGLSKGEYASLYVVNKFRCWFDVNLPYILDGNNWEENIRIQMVKLIEESNRELGRYGKKNGINVGTTCTALLTIACKYYLIHIGDTRVYEISDKVKQLTVDHTYLARIIAMGNAEIKEERKLGHSNEMLTQCVGACESLDPQYEVGEIDKNATYMLCSDGFRHKIKESELLKGFKSSSLKDEAQMEKQCNYYVDLNKKREEKDNISVIVTRFEE